VEEIQCAVTWELNNNFRNCFPGGNKEFEETNVQTTVLIKEECILKNKNKLCPYKKLSVFYNSCLKLLGRTLYKDKKQKLTFYI
jgi:hypothetical protein